MAVTSLRNEPCGNQSNQRATFSPSMPTGNFRCSLHMPAISACCRTFHSVCRERKWQHFFLPWCNSLSGPGPPHCQGFKITLRHASFGRTPLGEWSARRRNLYLKTHITHSRLTSMPPAVFEPAIPASGLPQTQALERAAARIGQQAASVFACILYIFTQLNSQCQKFNTAGLPIVSYTCSNLLLRSN